MGRLTEEMTRLREDVDNLSRERNSFIKGLGSDTAEMQAGFRDDHQKMAETEKKKRVEFLNELSTNVADMQTGFRQERKENAEQSIKELNAFVSNLRTSVSQMQNEFGKDRNAMISNLRTELAETLEMLEAFRKDFAQSSKEDRESRTAFLTHLKKDVVLLQQTFNEERCVAAEKINKELKTFVSNLGSTVYQMQNKFHESHENMARAGREERKVFVADLQGEVAQSRKVFGDDLAGARAAWVSKKKIVDKVPEAVGTPVPEKSVKTSPLPSPSQPEEEVNTASALDMGKENDVESKKDDKLNKKLETNVKKKNDLTYITGIGPGRLKQLNASGIFTFKQLGDLTPGALRELLGESSRLVDVTNWIKQARALL